MPIYTYLQVPGIPGVTDQRRHFSARQADDWAESMSKVKHPEQEVMKLEDGKTYAWKDGWVLWGTLEEMARNV